MVGFENITPIKTANTPELVKKSLAQDKDEVFSATSEERLKLMREIFNGISSETPVRVIRNATDAKKDVLLRDSSMHEIDYLGSGDKVTLVSDKKITGNTNGYSYIHRSVKIDGVDVNKIYVKVKTDAGQIGYVALEHIGKAEAKPAPAPKAEAKPAPAPKAEAKPAPVPKIETKPIAEVSKEDPKAITTVTSLPSGLLVARGPNQSQHPLISQGKMADMVITYEGPGGKRQLDAGNTYDIGGGINTGGPELERKYALGDNYTKWNSTFIPVDEVRNAVSKTLEARIARAYESCRKHEIAFDGLPLFAQKVLVDLHYNMNSIQDDFPKFWQAIKEKNWSEASKQLMDGGNGTPSKYLGEVYTRAYANAMILKNQDPDGAKKYKDEATLILKGTHNGQLLYDAYFGKTGKYGEHVGFFERRKIAKDTKDPAEFVDIILSDDVVKADKKSTSTVQSMIKKYLGENNNREVLISEFKKKLGGFSGPLDTGAKIAAYQTYVYLTDPEKFKKSIKFIDGQYGNKTKSSYLEDYYAEKGSEIVGKIQNVQNVRSLSGFEQSVLNAHLPKITDGTNRNSPENIIRLAQIMVILDNIENKDLSLPIDGKWSTELEKLLNSLPSPSSKEALSMEKTLKILSKKYTVKDRDNFMLEGLRGCAVRGAMNLASELGNPGDLVITGGTEGGHASVSFGSAEFTHGGGYKLDLRVTSGLSEYTGLSYGEKVEKLIRGQKVLFYRHGPNDHFDVTFYPVS